MMGAAAQRPRAALAAIPLSEPVTVVEFRVAETAPGRHAVERRTITPTDTPETSAWHELRAFRDVGAARADCERSAMHQLGTTPGWVVRNLSFVQTGRRPGQGYSVPADPAPGDGLTLRAQGYLHTFIGRL